MEYSALFMMPKKDSANREFFFCGGIMNRDIRTLDVISTEELEILKTKSVCVAGAGGLGGYAIEMLARLGVGRIRVVDGDRFEMSNLNRQLFSNEKNLGCCKSDEACQSIMTVNSDVKCESVCGQISAENAMDILEGMDVVIDCVDNLKARYIMQDACRQQNVPLIHGAVGAWQGQVSTIFPHDMSISKIYGDNYNGEIESAGTASFLPATVASYQVAECVKVILGKGEILRNKILSIDILNNQNYIVDLNENEESSV
jgi:molybdopterin/thiamine biosynthesis adenylyltransferase